jgi:YbbR domain-containing protein
VRKNIWLKVASVVLAIVLWVFVISRGYSDMSMTASVEFVNIPEGTQVVQSESTETVALAVRGHERVVKNLNSDEVSVLLDVTGLEAGKHQVGIDKKDVRLPIFVRLMGVNPSVATVSLEETSTKSVSVKPDIVGEPGKGYRLMRMKVTPGNVTVSGGKTGLEKLKWVKTEAVDIDGASESVSLEVKVALPGEGMESEPGSVTLEIAIEKARR